MSLFPGPVGQMISGIGKLLILVVMIVYVISPIDLMHEAILGPLGLLDDVAVLILGGSFLGLDFLKTAKGKRKEFQER